MKIFQIGDKVRFLNQKGEGTVRRFLGKTLVAVEIEEGFEIPVQISEIIPVEARQEKAAVISESSPPAAVVSGAPGVFLALIPDSVFASSFEMAIINNTGFTVLFNCTLQEGGNYTGLDSGILGPARHKVIYSTVKGETENWREIFIQVIFHQTGSFNPLPPVDRSFPFRSSQLSRVQLLKKAPQIDKSSYLFTIADTNDIRPFTREMVEQSFSGPSLKEKLRGAVSQEEREQHKNLRTNPKTGYMEVDLHIEELLDDYSGMSNAEIVTIQLRHCRKAIEKALSAKAGKLTIIHGVGNGTLKKEVRDLLREYENFRFYDAPYEKFGYGATEVLLK